MEPQSDVDRLVFIRQIEADVVDRLADLGCDPMPMTSTDLSKLFASETERWAKFIKAAGIRPE